MPCDRVPAEAGASQPAAAARAADAACSVCGYCPSWSPVSCASRSSRRTGAGPSPLSDLGALAGSEMVAMRHALEDGTELELLYQVRPWRNTQGDSSGSGSSFRRARRWLTAGYPRRHSRQASPALCARSLPRCLVRACRRLLQRPRHLRVLAKPICRCFQRTWMPWFASHGHEVYSVSLRNHGSSGPAGSQGSSLGSHARDLAHVIRSLKSPPVLAGHSFGGLVLQKCAPSPSDLACCWLAQHPAWCPAWPANAVQPRSCGLPGGLSIV